MKAIRFPSGDHDRGSGLTFLTIRRASPPSALATINAVLLTPAPVPYATLVPSGDQAG